MTVLRSTDAILRSIATYGAWRRSFFFTGSSLNHTAPTATAGGDTDLYSVISRPVVVPAMGAGVQGMYLTQCRPQGWNAQSDVDPLAGLIYSLGSVNLNGGAFTDGVTMPTKPISGLPAVQTASQLTLLHVTSTLTAVTPTITVTYVNQDGVGGRTAALALPTNAVVNSAYVLNSALQAGDTGIRDVTNITRSAGTAGIVTVYGMLLLGFCDQGDVSLMAGANLIPNPLCEAGDQIAVVFMTTRNVLTVNLELVGVAET